ncbi:hypothetical protein [Psychroserpens sp. SPM9]|uniref:hypothetical protein n=1 Tax=Psychroserpens sp. SPM9 TaxID=2975598 RepID=UPI0021A2C89F|nr:hypothetical protein [Psychroserpens sp. SPM9]MDG5491396.1 hypothetical protein [Psychroserpens sp. SPM9]
MMTIKNALLSLLVLFSFQLAIQAQQTNIWKDGHLTFVTKTLVDSEGDEDETDYDAGNDDVGINMEIIKSSELSRRYKDLEYSSSQGCLDMELELKSKGGTFLDGYKSYYSVCYDKEYKEYILNAVIYREDKKKYYDIALYCYTITVEEGLNVLKSIKFLD